jgi:hypothetical protein
MPAANRGVAAHVRRGIVAPGPRAMLTSTPLSRPLTPKDHDPLVTLHDACRYISALPREIADQQAWKEAARLALGALEDTPTDRVSIEAITKRIELALFVTHRLALGWRRASYQHRARRAASS